MPRKCKLDDAMKMEILMSRAHGETGRSIAERLPVSHAVVYSFLSSLPTPDSEIRIIKPDLDDDQMKRIFTLYLQGCTAGAIAEQLHIEKDKVTKLFRFVKQTKRSRTINYPLYPAVSAWMAENGYSATFLAEMIGVSKTEMLGTLAGNRYHLSLDMAQKIKKLSGLSLQEIFGTAIGNDGTDGSSSEAFEKEENEL